MIMSEMWILGAKATTCTGSGFGWGHWAPSTIQGKDEEEEEVCKFFSVKLLVCALWTQGDQTSLCTSLRSPTRGIGAKRENNRIEQS